MSWNVHVCLGMKSEPQSSSHRGMEGKMSTSLIAKAVCPPVSGCEAEVHRGLDNSLRKQSPESCLSAQEGPGNGQGLSQGHPGGWPKLSPQSQNPCWAQQRADQDNPLPGQVSSEPHVSGMDPRLLASHTNRGTRGPDNQFSNKQKII